MTKIPVGYRFVRYTAFGAVLYCNENLVGSVFQAPCQDGFHYWFFRIGNSTPIRTEVGSLEKAIALAARAHREQVRKNPIPVFPGKLE